MLWVLDVSGLMVVDSAALLLWFGVWSWLDFRVFGWVRAAWGFEFIWDFGVLFWDQVSFGFTCSFRFDWDLLVTCVLVFAVGLV